MNRNTMENNDTLAKLKSLRSQWNLNIEKKVLGSATLSCERTFYYVKL